MGKRGVLNCRRHRRCHSNRVRMCEDGLHTFTPRKEKSLQGISFTEIFLLLWTWRESNSRLRNANAAFYHLTTGPFTESLRSFPLYLYIPFEGLLRQGKRRALLHEYLSGSTR